MSWGWALDGLYLAMKHLNFTNKWLVYGNETIMPFYLLHQPVIIVIAFFVVQWEVGITLKLLVRHSRFVVDNAGFDRTAGAALQACAKALRDETEKAQKR